MHPQEVPLVLRRLVPTAYRPVLANRVFRRLILGFAVSYLGDGMSFVAVAWLAIELAPPATAGLWVGGAVAAYTLPGVVGALVFGRRLRRVPARRRLPASGHVSPVDQAAARGGLGLLRSHPELLGLLTLTWFFNFLYGPVEVALPLHVTDDLHAPGTLLGVYWMLFGIGAVLGGLAVGALRQLPIWPVTVVIVVVWGLALLPFGFDVPTAVTVGCFTLGGAIYGPFEARSVPLMQPKSPPQPLAAMPAAR